MTRAAWRPLVAASLLALAGCETAPEIVPVDDPEQAWRERQARLGDLSRWTAVGKLAVRSENDSWSVGVRWRQERDSYRIRLSGPLGQGLMELEGRPGAVEMRTAENDVYHAETADELLFAHAGWTLPLAGLRYWILGRSEPGSGVTGLALDAAGRPEHLRQSGWHIHYQRYGEFDGLALPTKLELEAPRVQARFVVRRWEL